MRVMNPGPGELYDRLSVLKLKIDSGKSRGMIVDSWEQEEYEILTALSGAHHTSDRVLVLQNELQAVNKRIWDGIDRQRTFAKVNMETAEEPVLRQIAYLGILIMEMNDVRAKLIGEINELFGIKRPEKIPSTSGNTSNIG